RRAELDTGLGHAAQLLEAEHLKAARIGEDWPLPVHETVQTAVRAHDLDARPKHQMKRVAEDHLRADRLELLGRHRLDRAVRADGHERRCVDDTAPKHHAAAPGGAVRREHFEIHAYLSCPGSVPAGECVGSAGVTNIASPYEKNR